MTDLISRLAARAGGSTPVDAVTSSAVAARPRPRSVFEREVLAGSDGPRGRQEDVPAARTGEPGTDPEGLRGTPGRGGGSDRAVGEAGVGAPDAPDGRRTGRSGEVGPPPRAERRTSAPQGTTGARSIAAVPEGTDPGAAVRGTTSLRGPSPPAEDDVSAGSGNPSGPGADPTDVAVSPRALEHVAVVPARPVPRNDAPPPASVPSARGPRRSGSEQSASGANTVRIHIGRLDVRANLEAVAPAEPAPTKRTEHGPSLEDYLRGAGAAR